MNKTEFDNLKTPCYIIDKQKFIENTDCMRSAFKVRWGDNITLGYSVKTNHFPYYMQLSKSLGYHAEVVSGSEFNYALSQGFSKFIYNGPCKDEETLIDALGRECIINVDNFRDIEIIENNINNLNTEKCLIGIRLNFDLEEVCKGETLMGEEGGRFGICFENGDFERALVRLKKANIPVSGLHMHVSSKTRSSAVYRALANKAAEAVIKYQMNDILFIDIGGGFFGGRIFKKYPTMQEYSEVICEELKKAVSPDKVQLILEPGASILATTCEYLCRVIHIKKIRNRTIVTVDGSLLHVRPFINSRPPDYTVFSEEGNILREQIVCGSTCMENDRLLYLYDYPELKVGDIIMIHYVGAYAMPHNNCFIDYPPRVYVKADEEYTLVRDKFKNMMEVI